MSKPDTSSRRSRALPGTAASSPWDVGSGPDLAGAGVKRQTGAGSAALGQRCPPAVPAEIPRVPAGPGARPPPPGGGRRGARGPLPRGAGLRRGPLSREYGKHVRITCGRSRRPRRGTGREGGTGRDPRSAGRAGPL